MPPSVGAPRCVVVLRFGAYGDVLCIASALQTLRRELPDARILVGVRAEFAEAVRHHPAVDDLVIVERGEGVWSYARKLRAAAPDAVLDLHGKLRSFALRFLLPRVPFTTWRQRSLWEAVRVRLLGGKPRSATPILHRFHAAVERFLGRAAAPSPLRAFPGPTSGAEASALLVAGGVDPARPLLGLSPGANWATKRWPIERYAEVARLALASGFQVATVGSLAERPLGAALVELAPGVMDLTGTFDLATLPGFVQRCAAFVGNDSGPMHLARALGVPTVAIFGSTDPGNFELAPAMVAWAGVECAPCSFHGLAACPRGHLRCLTGVSATVVWQKVLAATGR